MTASSCRKGRVQAMVCVRSRVAAAGLRAASAAKTYIAPALVVLSARASLVTPASAVLAALSSRARFRGILLALGVWPAAAKESFYSVSGCLDVVLGSCPAQLGVS